MQSSDFQILVLVFGNHNGKTFDSCAKKAGSFLKPAGLKSDKLVQVRKFRVFKREFQWKEGGIKT